MKLGSQAVDEVRRRVQHDTLGRRGHKNDPLYRIRNVLRAGQENLTERQRVRLLAPFTASPEHVEVAWHCAQQLRAVFHAPSPAVGRRLATKIVDTFHTCPIPEVAPLGRTLRQWREAFLAYFDTAGASNCGTEAVNGLIELRRRIARGFTNREN